MSLNKAKATYCTIPKNHSIEKISILFFSAVCMLVAVILFPVKFTDNFPFNAHFDFEWAYGLAWAAMCFILTAAILFLISVDTKEIYHAEKKLAL